MRRAVVGSSRSPLRHAGSTLRRGSEQPPDPASPPVARPVVLLRSPRLCMDHSQARGLGRPSAEVTHEA
jgi:hypothetical protein